MSFLANLLPMHFLYLVPGTIEGLETSAEGHGDLAWKKMAKDITNSRNTLLGGVALSAISLIGAAYDMLPKPLTLSCIFIGGAVAAIGGKRYIEAVSLARSEFQKHDRIIFHKDS